MGANLLEKTRVKIGKCVRITNLLANPETLFTQATWAQTFKFIDDCLFSIPDKDSTEDLRIEFKELYFRKMYLRYFDFGRARRMISQVVDAPAWWFQFDDHEYFERNKERLMIKNGIEFKLDPDDSFKRQMGRITKTFAVAIFSIPIEDKSSVIWETNKEHFLKFTDIVEKIFIGQGESLQCRVSMTVSLHNANIDLHCDYHVPMFIRCLVDPAKEKIKYTSPEAMITFK